ncbi:MAG: hypothetical protein BWY78_00659 [Alphaproteobacteria bacterium ADurb.Bin438]|nr:MAG: hypothetical protein BWY78_00659 [Alphaproteobacteria bacterium ADurb.Bin438]
MDNGYLNVKNDILKAKGEKEIKASLVSKLREFPMKDGDFADNIGLFMTRQLLSRIIFMHEMYKNILTVPGVVMEFGVYCGQNLNLFSSFRGMYEPANHTRKIIGFDTYSGFPSVKKEDGELAVKGNFKIADNYEQMLDEVLDMQEQLSPLPHIKKHELVKGDASVTIKEYLKNHPETLISMAYFDMDLYEPTKNVLKEILPYMPKGAVIGFDELNAFNYPGETVALKEVLKLRDARLVRAPYTTYPSYMILD